MLSVEVHRRMYAGIWLSVGFVPAISGLIRPRARDNTLTMDLKKLAW